MWKGQRTVVKGSSVKGNVCEIVSCLNLNHNLSSDRLLKLWKAALE